MLGQADAGVKSIKDRKVLMITGAKLSSLSGEGDLNLGTIHAWKCVEVPRGNSQWESGSCDRLQSSQFIKGVNNSVQKEGKGVENAPNNCSLCQM